MSKNFVVNHISFTYHIQLCVRPPITTQFFESSLISYLLAVEKQFNFPASSFFHYFWFAPLLFHTLSTIDFASIALCRNLKSGAQTAENF